MLSAEEKTALQLEYNSLVSANLKKDGSPKKKADAVALARIDEIREIAKLENQRFREAERIARRAKENEYLASLGFIRGQQVFVCNPITGEKELGTVSCAELPDAYATGGNIGVSFGGYPWMFRPEDVFCV